MMEAYLISSDIKNINITDISVRSTLIKVILNYSSYTELPGKPKEFEFIIDIYYILKDGDDWQYNFVVRAERDISFSMQLQKLLESEVTKLTNMIMSDICKNRVECYG